MSTTPRPKMHGKPVYTVPARTVINLKSHFGEKLLCDGPTFSTGSACVYSCAFCYVDSLMHKNPHTKEIRKEGKNFEDVVIRRDGAIDAVKKQLLDKNGLPRYKDSSDTRVIYASPLVDVAGNMELVRETVEVCKLILEHTNWQIRLLSKSNLLFKLAQMIDDDYRDRMIYGVSTGTLDDKLAKAFEKGTALVSKRLESLHKLQDEGYRTYGMICPSLPQDDYDEFAKEMAQAIRVDRCEHVWAEVINLRGKSFERTIEALNAGGLKREAEQLEEVRRGDLWEDYARETFLAHQKHIDASKLRFMQYPKRDTIDWWKQHEDAGAILLGATVAAPGKIKLSKEEADRFRDLNRVVSKAAKSFVDAGIALHEIRSRKLYREKHRTFENYCQSVHSISRQYANSLIRAGKVTKELETIVSKNGLPLPNNEAQVRELVKVTDSAQRAEIYKDALEVVDGDVELLTAEVIRTEVGKSKSPGEAMAVPRKTPSARIKEARDLVGQIEKALSQKAAVNGLLKKLKAALEG